MEMKANAISPDAPPAYSYGMQPPPPGPSSAWQQQEQWRPPPAPVQPGGTTVVVQQQAPPPVITTNVVLLSLSSYPANIQCPNCRNQVTTLIHKENGNMVWLVAGVMILLGWWLCLLVPFCTDAFKDTAHTCPVCNFTSGRCSQL